MYSPLIGQFAQRDPLGYAAGDANLLRYCGNRAVSATDPLGTSVRIDCVASDEFKEWLRDNKVEGYRAHTPAPQKYEFFYPTDALNATGSEEGKIAKAMIAAEYRTFFVRGSTSAEVMANWNKHIRARLAIVAAAESVKFPFLDSDATPDKKLKYNRDVWNDLGRPKEGDYFKAIEDMWKHPSEYGVGCAIGAYAVLQRGISQIMDQTGQAGDFNTAMAGMNAFGNKWIPALIIPFTYG